MKTIEIFWHDLSDAKQEEIMEEHPKFYDENLDVSPIATIDYEEEEEE